MKNIIYVFCDDDKTSLLTNYFNDTQFEYKIIRTADISDWHSCDIAYFYTNDDCTKNKINSIVKVGINSNTPDAYHYNVYINDNNCVLLNKTYNNLTQISKKLLLDSNVMNKIVLITGCSGGIGSKITEDFYNNGYFVIGTDSYKKDNIFTDIFIEGDLCDDDTYKKIIEKIENEIGVLDCIINVAAIQKCCHVWEMNEDEWDRIYKCNVKSIFMFVKYGLNILKKRKGNIVNIGSVHSVNTANKIAAYGSSKAAVVGLTRNLAIELAEFNIRVNCISPGAIDTSMLRSGLRRGHLENNNLTDDDLVSELGSRHLMKEVGRTCHISQMALFLADNNKSGFTTGANFIIDGGATIKLSTE